jgi:hypothetical protein
MGRELEGIGDGGHEDGVGPQHGQGRSAEADLGRPRPSDYLEVVLQVQDGAGIGGAPRRQLSTRHRNEYRIDTRQLSPLRGFGVILSVAATVGIISAIWVVWFGVGFILVVSIAVDAITGRPWYEIAWALVALTLLCWPSSWAYINSGGVAEGSPSAEEQQVIWPVEYDGPERNKG